MSKVKIYGMSERYKGGEYQETTMRHDPRLADGWVKFEDYKSDFDELTRQNKILRDALEYVLEDHDCEHIDCIEFNKQRAREALKSCGGGDNE